MEEAGITPTVRREEFLIKKFLLRAVLDMGTDTKKSAHHNPQEQLLSPRDAKRRTFLPIIL